MNISSTGSSYYLTSASANKGFSGLASGLDTESMVEAMLSGTQAKIDRQNALRQQTVWKQEIYRDLISRIQTFQSKYFSTSSSAYLGSASFFNTMAATASSAQVKVTATSGAAAQTASVRVRQLASATRLSSGAPVSGVLSGLPDAAAIERLAAASMAEPRTVAFESNGKTVTVDLSDLFLNGTGGFASDSADERLDAIAQRIQSAFADAGQSGVTVSRQNGGLCIQTDAADHAVKVSSKSSSEGLRALGLTAGAATAPNAAQPGQTLTAGAADFSHRLDLQLSLDGISRSISLDLTALTDAQGRADLSGLRDLLAAEAERVHGKGQIAVSQDAGGRIALSTAPGRKVMVTGASADLAALGLKNGQSNTVGLGGRLGDLQFSNAAGLTGEGFAFSINGVDFTFDANDTIGDVINAVNRSGAGVRLSYTGALQDIFVLESTSSGAGFDIELSQSRGNLLNMLFGSGADGQLATGTEAASRLITTGRIAGEQNAVNLYEGALTMTVNGQSVTFTLPKKTDESGNAVQYDAATAVEELNRQMLERFGANGSGEALLEIDADGGLVIRNYAAVSIASGGALGAALGLAGKDNTASGDATLSEVGLDLGLSGGTRLSELSGSLQFADGRLLLTGSGETVSVGSEADMRRLFGSATVALGTADSSAAKASLAAGVNARVSVNGVETERASNTFELNGLNLTLTAAHKTGEPDTQIEVSRNTDALLAAVRSFISDYNELIGELNARISEDANYKKYAPLTAEQKKEMSEREIELWEEKAKQGLLRNDSTISGLLSSMRAALYEKPAGTSLAIYQLGIETSSDWTERGKLVLTPDGEAQLIKMLESDPESVIRLFADEDEGLAARMQSILDSAAKGSSGNPGALVKIAGVAGRASETQNQLYTRLQDLDNKIAALQRTYEREKARYWNQFNAMEELISNMNSQSAWLTMQLG